MGSEEPNISALQVISSGCTLNSNPTITLNDSRLITYYEGSKLYVSLLGTSSSNEEGQSETGKLMIIAIPIAFGVFFLVFLVLLYRWKLHSKHSKVALDNLKGAIARSEAHMSSTSPPSGKAGNPRRFSDESSEIGNMRQSVGGYGSANAGGMEVERSVSLDQSRTSNAI